MRFYNIFVLVLWDVEAIFGLVWWDFKTRRNCKFLLSSGEAWVMAIARIQFEFIWVGLVCPSRGKGGLFYMETINTPQPRLYSKLCLTVCSQLSSFWPSPIHTMAQLNMMQIIWLLTLNQEGYEIKCFAAAHPVRALSWKLIWAHSRVQPS